MTQYNRMHYKIIQYNTLGDLKINPHLQFIITPPLVFEQPEASGHGFLEGQTFQVTHGARASGAAAGTRRRRRRSAALFAHLRTATPACRDACVTGTPSCTLTVQVQQL